MKKDLEYRQIKAVGTAMMEQLQIMKKTNGRLTIERWLFDELLEVLQEMHYYQYYDLQNGLHFAEDFYSRFYEITSSQKKYMTVHFKLEYEYMFLDSAKCFLNPKEK